MTTLEASAKNTSKGGQSDHAFEYCDANSLETMLVNLGINPLSPDLNLIEEWQRFPTVDKPHKRNGSVLVRRDGAVIGKNWGLDETTVWYPNKGSNTNSSSQRKRRQDQRQIKNRQADSAELARHIWEHAKRAERW